MIQKIIPPSRKVLPVPFPKKESLQNTTLKLIVLLQLFCCPQFSMSQDNSQQLISHGEATTKKPYPYGLDKVWSYNVSVNAISPNGEWIAFTENFFAGENILRLKQIDKDTEIRLPEGLKNKFSFDNNWFASLSTGNTLVVINLENATRMDFTGIMEFDFSFDGRYLALLQSGKEDSILKIMDLKNTSIQDFSNISKFAWNPANHNILMAKENSENNILLYDAALASQTWIKNKPSGNVDFLKWNTTGSAALIMEHAQEKEHLGVYYPNKGFILLKDELMADQLAGYELTNKEPYLSMDGTKVLFSRKQIGIQLGKEDKIEIWKTSDPLLYPSLKIRKDFIYPYLLTAWYPQDQILKEIATPQFPSAETDIEHTFALVYNELQYGDENNEVLKADIYCKNIRSGKMHLFVAHQPLNDQVSVSPSGNYIAYFKNENWWSYNVKENKAVNITKGLGTTFQNRDNEHPKDRTEVYDKPAWLQNDSKIIVTDKYDLWSINPNGTDPNRITKGREKNCHYLLKRDNEVDSFYHLTVGSFSGRKVDLNNYPLIQQINFESHSMGISLLNKDLSITSLNFMDRSIFQIYQSQNSPKVIYSTESTIFPPAFHQYDLKLGKSNLVYQSNSELLDYDLGHKTFIEYTLKNKKLTGTLMYPANYDPSKKYPLIVYIYDKTSRMAMEFHPPTGYNFQGFSLLDYTSSGYFVLLPNITYEINKPGLSALECVNVAVDKTLENKSIDSTRMALIGHSFGGYETAFIATQTDRFATYVAGAAATDVTSHYHGVNWNNSATDLWRYEDQQWRMGSSYYENKQAYLKNSPLEFVTNVKKPILLWTGDKDYQVAWTQSLEMYIALRRLKKEASLILVKDEGHSPWDPEKQLLLSTEIRKWLDGYLKKENGES